jgi:hypothetical protein
LSPELGHWRKVEMVLGGWHAAMGVRRQVAARVGCSKLQVACSADVIAVDDSHDRRNWSL